jgi:DNA-binding response OmpR family regulator
MDNVRAGVLSSRVLHVSITTLQLARARSRRGYLPVAASADNASTLYAGELEIRLGEGLVLATGRALKLSVREFGLLAAMARQAGAIVTREELYAEVWGGELRPGDRSVIHTHPGFGYRFQPQPARDANVAVGAPRPLESADSAEGEPRRLSRNVHIEAVGDS